MAEYETHEHDVLIIGAGGAGLRAAVESSAQGADTALIHAQEAPARVLELEEWGALFDRTKDGLILQRDFGGHRYARLAHVGDRTGLELIRTLQQRVVHLDLDVHMECNIQRLMKDGDRVSGAFGYWRATGKFVLFKSKAVVLATGGVGKAWKFTSNSWECTG